MFFPYNSKNKGERQKWISDSDSTSMFMKELMVKYKVSTCHYILAISFYYIESYQL